MSKPSFASTRRINPPGATPVLTHEQVWKGLGIKAREPKTFVAAITSCKVVSDEGNKIVRSVSFGEAASVTEAVEMYGDTIAYFENETGTRITNLISYGENGELLLTFTFANGIPGFPDTGLSDTQELNRWIGGGVEHTINRLRELAREGTI